MKVNTTLTDMMPTAENKVEYSLSELMAALQCKNEISELIASFDKKLSQFEWHQQKILHDINILLTSMQATSESIDKDYQKIFEQMQNTCQQRLNIINEQSTLIQTLSLRTIKHMIKSLVSPKIGNLHHHAPRPCLHPKSYQQTKALSATPRISIVTPSYNQAEFLETTIKSVLDQHYPNLEYIVQDGDSKDRSVDILKQYSASLTRWESCPDKGQSDALNIGFKHATGDIMAYLNSDDILLPGTLNYVVDYFNRHPEVDVVYGHRILIDEDDNEIGRWVLPPHNSDILTWVDYVPQETLFWRRTMWDKVGAHIDANFRFAMDWDLLIRFKQVNANFKRLPRFLGAFRVHTKQKTSSQMSDIGMREMRLLRKRCHGRNVTDYEINKNIRSYKIAHVLFNRLYRLGILRY